MKKISRLSMLLIGWLIAVNTTVAQQPPFYNEVQKLKKKDQAEQPAPNGILFTGSSSFTKWTDVQEYFPGYPIINRAFGGSTIPDLIRYADEVILPYKPKQVVIYCGDNDLASSDTVTPATVLVRFQQLFKIIRSHQPNAHILYVSIKPSPSRAHLLEKMKSANYLIRTFLQPQPRTAFADVFTPMLLPNGQPDPSLFVEDNLHMNAKGYAIWQKVLKPHLKK